MISFRCGQCGKDLQVKDELAGKKVRCPGCQKVAAVPQLAASLSPPPSSAGGQLRINPEEKEEKTLAWTPGVAEAKSPGQAGQESLANSGEGTAPGVGGKGDGTQALPGQSPSPELYGFLAPAQKPDEIGRLGPYRVLKVLGAGGMGVVFKAEDPGLQRLVALKAMRPALANSASSKERFFREARAAAALKHPHIVTIFQVGENRGAPFLAMEFLDGESLDDRLKRETRLSAPEILHIGRQIAEGLAAAHAKGLIHRDIKPANIWLETTHHSPQTNIKILDFGLARALSDETHLTQSGAIVGTPAYMAPEQAEGLPVDHRCDLFSLGCVLYRMCTGNLPFKGATTLAILSALAQKDPPPPLSLNADVPAELSDLVMRLLAKKPQERPESAKKVAEMLQKIEAQTAERLARLQTKIGQVKGTEPAPSPTGRSAKKRRPLARLVGAGVLGLGILGLLWFFLLRPGDKSPDKKNGETLPTKFTSSLGMEFVLIPAGKFMMGSPPQEIDRCLKLAPDQWYKDSFKSEGPEHEVEITQPFYMGVTEVTVGQFRHFVTESKYQVGNDRWQKPDFEQGDDHPVVGVSWQNAVDFCAWLSKKEDKKHRLPTEAEWEYCCRAGGRAGSKFGFGDDDADLSLYAWHKTNSDGRSHPVGQLKKNAFGLYDMHGNAFEWCYEDWDPDYYQSSPKQNPPGPTVGRIPAVRGGSWSSGPVECRSAFRNRCAVANWPWDIGFRVVVPVSSPPGVRPEEKKPPVEVKLPPAFKNGIGMEFVLVPKGKSWLGGGGGKPGTKEVEILHDFYLGKYEVTQEEWEKVTGSNPSKFKELLPGVAREDQKRFPVEMVSWEDCQEFIKRLNEKVKEAGWIYRLPKEPEWEYACRGGPLGNRLDSAFDFYFEKPTNQLLPEQANFEHDKGRKRTCKVGTYKPNRLGLHDMHGNVWEWCEDEVPQPKGALSRVSRGGSWDVDSGNCRAARHVARPPSSRINPLGLRLARVPVGKEIIMIVPAGTKPPVEAKLPPTFKNDLGMEFVLVPRGKSWLGGGGGKPGTKEVEIVNDFYLGKYEVTQEEWQNVMGKNPSSFSAGGQNKDAVKTISASDLKRFPVENVSAEDAEEFIKRVNEKVKEAGWLYRLPTEEEWEYACRGGPMTDKSESAFDYYFDKPTNNLSPAKANYNSMKRPCKVGTFYPNRLGLYDMHGNVWEWCAVDKQWAGLKEAARVNRGGSWSPDSGTCRAVERLMHAPSSRHSAYGLRLARVPIGKESK